LMADMKSGQRLIFVAKPGAGVEVNVNGTVKGTIESKAAVIVKNFSDLQSLR